MYIEPYEQQELPLEDYTLDIYLQDVMWTEILKKKAARSSPVKIQT